MPLLGSIVFALTQVHVRRLPVGYVDYFGFAKSSQFNTDRITLLGIQRLESGEYVTAYQMLLKCWRRNKSNYMALHGLTLAAIGDGKISLLLSDLDTEVRTGGRKAMNDKDLTYGIFYATTVAEHFAKEGVNVRMPRGTVRPMGYPDLSRIEGISSSSDRAYVFMTASSFFELGEYGRARQALRDWIASHPQDVAARLNLGRMYQFGTLRTREGNGQWEMAPREEWMDMKKALEQYRAAITIDSRCADAWYELGNALPAKDPQHIQALQKAVQLGLLYPPRNAAARKKLGL